MLFLLLFKSKLQKKLDKLNYQLDYLNNKVVELTARNCELQGK